MRGNSRRTRAMPQAFHNTTPLARVHPGDMTRGKEGLGNPALPNPGRWQRFVPLLHRVTRVVLTPTPNWSKQRAISGDTDSRSDPSPVARTSRRTYERITRAA